MLLLRIINLGLFLELREHISRRIRPRLKDGLTPTTQDRQTLTSAQLQLFSQKTTLLHPFASET
jgi:hypothetical protein